MDLVSAWLDEGSVKGAIATTILGLVAWVIKPYWTAWRARREDRRNEVPESLLRIELFLVRLDERTKDHGRAIEDQRLRLHNHLQNEESQAIVDSASRKERQLVIDAELTGIKGSVTRVHERVDELYTLIASRLGGMGGHSR